MVCANNTSSLDSRHADRILDQRYRDLAPATVPLPRSIFSYYGSKSKISDYYPAPRERWIIEPFGGSASYAWLHCHGHDVWVNEIDPITYGIWLFLQSAEAAKCFRRLPKTIAIGARVEDVVKFGPESFRHLLMGEMDRGTQGRLPVNGKTRVTAWGADYYWLRLRRKFERILPIVQNWRITNESFTMIPNQRATWFIDPPYSGAAGRRYRYATIDYVALAEWSRAREGQVIVCENVGATWLPFRPLTAQRNVNRNRSRGEAVWTDDSTYRQAGLFE